MINGKLGQGAHCTKMGVDKSAENNPNAPKYTVYLIAKGDK